MRAVSSIAALRTAFSLLLWLQASPRTVTSSPVLGPPGEGRAAQLEQALSSIFPALPKSSQGMVRSSTAEYALRRLFSQRYGWQLYGHRDASALLTFGGQLSDNATAWLQDRLASGGLRLGDVALLAAVIEDMVHAEADSRLLTAFWALDTPTDGPLTGNESTQILEAYMASFVLGAETQDLKADSMLEMLREVPEQYPTWPATQAFLQEVKEEVAPNSAELSLTDLSRVVAAVDERYGQWQSHECRALKRELLRNEEHPHTGRVRLSDFYSLALKGGQWQFSESSSYLRQIGALDETDPAILKVVIPNYILGLSNCVAASSYYMVCCINECDAHLGSLEQALQSHQAPTEAILRALNRTVAPSLVRRLQEIAAHHSGMVPLHGRLFAQWLHHLYPHDCPYPHMSGTTDPLQPEVFEEEMGLSAEASKEEMIQHVEGAPWRAPPTHEEGMCSHMWSMEEELIDPAAHLLPQSQAFASQRLAAALVSLCLLSVFGTTLAAAKGGSATACQEGSRRGCNSQTTAVYAV